MGCFAKLVAKSVVTNEEILEIMANHLDEVAELFRVYLKTKGRTMRVLVADGAITLFDEENGSYTIKNGKIEYVETRTTGSQRIFRLLTEALPKIGDLMFARELANLLRGMDARIDAVDATETTDGIAQRIDATVGPMKYRILVLSGGQVEIQGLDGAEFPVFKAVTESMMEKFAEKGVNLALQGEMENHRDGLQHVHLVEQIRHQQRQVM